MNENKENVKLKKIFTKLRNTINNREDEFLLQSFNKWKC